MSGSSRAFDGPCSQRRSTTLLHIGLVLWVAFIWGQSLIPAKNSSGESEYVLFLLERITGFSTETLPFDFHYLLRKLAHFCEYAVLGALSAAEKRVSGQHGRLYFWLGPAVGAIDETLQLFSPGRAAMVGDVAIDSLGFYAGFGVANALISWRGHSARN